MSPADISSANEPPAEPKSQGELDSQKLQRASLPKVPVEAVPLSKLTCGSSGVVVDVAAHNLCTRFMELGLVPGASVRVLCAGDPMLVAVGDSRLALARESLQCVLVEKC